MATITAEEFRKLYGFVPGGTPNPALPDVAPTIPRRRFTNDVLLDAVKEQMAPSAPIIAPEPVVDQGNEKAYSMGDEREQQWDQYEQNAPNWAKPIVGGARRFTSNTQQLQSNIASGVMQLPAEVPAFVDLARIGVPAVLGNIVDPNPETEESYIDRVGQSFIDGAVSPEGQANLEQFVIGKVSEFQTAKPDATPEELEAFVKGVQDTDEFFNELTNNMSPGLKLGQQANLLANEIAGLGKRPDQQTLVDDLQQMAGQSVVGLAPAAVAQIRNKFRKIVGDKVADAVVTRVTTKALELLTPATLPLTPGNVAANMVVGGALTEGIRTVTNQPSLLNGGVADLENATPLVPFEPADGHGENVTAQTEGETLKAGVTLGAIFSMPLLRRQLKDQAVSAAEKRVAEMSVKAGPARSEQGDVLDPLLAPTTGLIDSNSPLKKAANQFKMPSDKESVDLIDAHMSAASAVNSMEMEVNALSHGLLPNMAPTIPLRNIARAKSQLKPVEQDQFDKFMLAKQRQQDLAIFTKGVDEQLQQTVIRYNAAKSRGDTREVNSLYKQMEELSTKKSKKLADDPELRSSLTDWSEEDVNTAIAVGEANPAVKALAEQSRKVATDITDMLVKNGRITAEEGAYRKTSRPFYIPLREIDYAADAEPVRQAKLFKDRIVGSPSGKGVFDSSKLRDVSGESTIKVNRPKPPLEALQMAMKEAVHGVAINNARREVVDILRRLPGAEGKVLRAHEFDVGNGRKVTSISEAQLDIVGRPKNIDEYIPVYRDGKVEFWQFSDKSMTHSLKFAPLTTVPILNETRKIWQNMTTGLGAPWFAPVSLIWDTQMAMTTARNGRAVGMLDTYARKMFAGNHAAQWVQDRFSFDPTFALHAGGSVTYAMAMRSTRAVAEKIGDDLAKNSGIFGTIAQIPGGKGFLTHVGESMSKAFDRSVYHVFEQKLPVSMAHMDDTTRIANSYNVTGQGLSLGPQFRTLANAYKATIESVQHGAKLAFFAENYSLLEYKYKNKGGIPETEMMRLVQDTRNLSGDMSRTSNNKYVQGFTSVFPYSNAILQGTRHILGATVPPSVAKGVNALTGGKANMLTDRTSRFWPLLLSAVILPKLGSAAVMSDWPGAEDYWENKTPDWMKATVIPFPNMDALMYRYENGEWPEFSVDYLNHVPLAPELGMISEPVMGGLRALGLIGSAPKNIPTPFGVELKLALDQLTSLAAPPLLNAFAASTGNTVDIGKAFQGQLPFQEVTPTTFGGVNEDAINWGSDVNKNLYNVLGAVFGAGVQIAVQTFDVHETAMDSGDDFWEAWDKASAVGSYELARKLPEVDIPYLFDSKQRRYAFTPESQYVFQTETTLRPLFAQRSVEADSKDRIPQLVEKGLQPPPQLADPLLRDLTNKVHERLNQKGSYKQASDQYTETRVQLNALEASRAEWSEGAYHTYRNDLVKQQQLLKEIQAQELQALERELTNDYGEIFQANFGKPLSYTTLVQAIDESTRK